MTRTWTLDVPRGPLSQKLFIGLSRILFRHFLLILISFEVGGTTGVIAGIAIRSLVRGQETCKLEARRYTRRMTSTTFGLLKTKKFTNLSFNLLSTFPFRNSETAIKQKITEMIHLMALPIFDSTLKLCHRCKAMLFAERLIRSIKD